MIASVVPDFWRQPVLMVAVFGMLVSGCSSESGLKKYEFSGQVTFNGKPVPVGYISFEPNKVTGPGSMAKIVEGYYETSKGKGLIGGPYRILISGFSGSSGPDQLGDGSPLFVDYTLEMTLPLEDTTQNFEITNDDLKK